MLLALGVGSSLLGGAPLTAQSLVDPILPGGTIGLGIIPTFSTWDSRYGVGGAVQPLGADLTAQNAASLFPGVTTLEQDLKSLTGSTTGFPSVLGPVETRVSKETDRVEFEGRLGLFDWLTLGVMVPVSRVRVPVDVAFRPDTVQGNLGRSPAATGDGGVATLLYQLDQAASAAAARATMVCDSTPASAGCSSATDLAQRANSFAAQTQSAYYASPFFPLEGSQAATALTGALASLNQDLTGAGLTAVQAPFVFPSAYVDAATFAQIPGDPAGSIRSTPLTTLDGLWQVGDVEVSAMIRLLHGEVRDSGAAEPRLSWELAGGGLVRLGTGRPANPDILFDVGSGDGQTDFEGSLYGALGFSHWAELRAVGKYGIQQSVVQLRRVAPPGTILAPYSSLQQVRWSPGSYLYVQVSPRLYLSQGFSLTCDYDYYHKGPDAFTSVATPQGAAPTLDASVLAQETAVTLRQAGLGLTYSTLQAHRAGEGWLPAELDARVVWAVGGSGGRTPKVQRMQIAARVFKRLWGGS